MLDLLALCQKQGVPFLKEGHHHCHEGWVQIHCPFCAGGRNGWHLGFNLASGGFSCWRCGGVKVYDVVRALLHTSDPHRIAAAFSEFSTTATRHSAKKQTPRKKAIKPPPGIKPLGQAHKRYLRRRGFDCSAIIELWAIQSTHHLSGSWNWRIVAPICNQEGLVTAYVGRAIGSKVRPKYKMTEAEHMLQDPRSVLYGIDKVPGDAIVIVEGITDVWRLGPGAVGCIGINWKSEQANILRLYSRRFVLFDPERQAQRQAERLARWLSIFPGQTEIILLDKGVDPGGLSYEEAEELMKSLGV